MKIKISITLLIILILSILIFTVSANITATPQKTADLRAATAAAANQTPINILPEAPPAPQISTLLFSGDVMLSRNVGQKMEKYGDWAWPFAAIASMMSSADLAIINLESPFTVASNHLVPTGSFSFNADPRAIAGLIAAGVDVATLANNHTMNQGAKGLGDTKRILADNGIAVVGAGSDSAEAAMPAIEKINGVKFGFLGFAYPTDKSVAGSSTPSIAGMDIAKMAATVKELKNQSDIAVVLMHAGTEYAAKPNQQQMDFARAAIDAGADLVVGHHPHWVQTAEIYKGKPILYSLGNLVFDQMWSQETREGALAKAIWQDKSLRRIELIPISIRDYGRAEIVTSTLQRQKILKRMGLTDDTIEF